MVKYCYGGWQQEEEWLKEDGEWFRIILNYKFISLSCRVPGKITSTLHNKNHSAHPHTISSNIATATDAYAADRGVDGGAWNTYNICYNNIIRPNGSILPAGCSCRYGYLWTTSATAVVACSRIL